MPIDNIDQLNNIEAIIALSISHELLPEERTQGPKNICTPRTTKIKQNTKILFESKKLTPPAYPPVGWVGGGILRKPHLAYGRQDFLSRSSEVIW